MFASAALVSGLFQDVSSMWLQSFTPLYQIHPSAPNKEYADIMRHVSMNQPKTNHINNET